MGEARPIPDIESIESLDAARLALRWALERIAALEKNGDELAAKLGAEERAEEKLRDHLAELQKALGLRSAESDQRELYYAKLEEYLSLKLEGKLDPAVLAEREMEVSRLQDMLAQKQNYLDKDYAARKEALERDYQRLKTEAEARSRDALRRSEASLEAEREARERETLLKTAEFGERKAELDAEAKTLAERKARFDGYYNEQKSQLHAALKNFRDEIKGEVALRVQMAERVLEERRESLEKVFAEERKLLNRELESWKAKALESGPRLIELDKALALSQEKAAQAQSLSDRMVLSREQERRMWQAEKEALEGENEVWRGESAGLRKSERALRRRSLELEGLLERAMERIEFGKKETAAAEERGREEREGLRLKGEALAEELAQARGQADEPIQRLIRAEKEASTLRQAAAEASLKASRSDSEAEGLKNRLAFLQEEALRLVKNAEAALQETLEADRKAEELQSRLSRSEKERARLEERLKGCSPGPEIPGPKAENPGVKESAIPPRAESLWPPVEWKEKNS